MEDTSARSISFSLRNTCPEDLEVCARESETARLSMVLGDVTMQRLWNNLNAQTGKRWNYKPVKQIKINNFGIFDSSKDV